MHNLEHSEEAAPPKIALNPKFRPSELWYRCHRIWLSETSLRAGRMAGTVYSPKANSAAESDTHK